MKKNMRKKLTCILFLAIALYGCDSEDKLDENLSVNVETIEINNITENSAIIYAKVNSIDESLIISRGICLNTVINPTVENIRSEETRNTISEYNFLFENLDPNTKYYTRSYVLTNSGIIYGNELSFTTDKIGLPSISTNQPSSIYTSTATIGGKILSDGGSKFSSVGVCVSDVNPIPTIVDSKTDLISTSENVFEINLSGLKANTKYYARAFGTNSLGTFYGETIVFTTKPVGLPVLKISTLSGSGLTANVGASVINNGGEIITSYGFVWSKFENPDITWQNVSKTKHEGTFSNLTYFSGTLIGGIFPSTTHYVRAYATNSYGTGYSPQLTFTTGKN